VRDARRLQARARGDQLTLGGERHQDRLVHAARLGVRPTAMIPALALDRNHRDTGMPCQYREVARSLTPVSGHLGSGGLDDRELYARSSASSFGVLPFVSRPTCCRWSVRSRYSLRPSCPFEAQQRHRPACPGQVPHHCSLTVAAPASRPWPCCSPSPKPAAAGARRTPRPCGTPPRSRLSSAVLLTLRTCFGSRALRTRWTRWTRWTRHALGVRAARSSRHRCAGFQLCLLSDFVDCPSGELLSSREGRAPSKPR